MMIIFKGRPTKCEAILKWGKVLCFMVAAMPFSFAQNLIFKKYQVNNGLSENSVQCILQDDMGYMWFGTKDGLNRFDGHDYKIFKSVATDSTSIGNNFIRSLWQRADRKIWVGTDQGLYLFDPDTEKFEHFKYRTDDGTSVTGPVNAICVDNQQNLWLGVQYQGLFCHSPGSDELTLFGPQEGHEGLDTGIIWKLHKDASGTLWIGTRRGLGRYTHETKTFFNYGTQNTHGTMTDPEVLAVYDDSDGDVWIGTWAGGLGLLNKASDSFTFFFTNKTGNPINHIRSVYEYEKGKFLIGSDDGLYFFDKQTREEKRLDDPRNPLSLSDQNVYCIYADKEKALWIGTYFGGVNYLPSIKKHIEHYFPNHLEHSISGKAVSQFCEDEKGNLWIATEDGGLNYFDTRTKQFKVYLPNGQKNSLSYHNLHSLIIHRNKLWIGTFSKGIDVLDLKTQQFTNYQYSKTDPYSIDDNCVFALYKSKSGSIYVGTPFGLSVYNETKGNFVRIKEVRNFVYDIQEDHAGHIWVASYGNGVYKINLATGNINHYTNNPSNKNSLAFNKVTDIYYDSQQRLWFATEGNGICKYNYDTDNFTTINSTNGLPNNVAYGILDDRNGDIWVSTNMGITKITPSTLAMKTYTREDGLQSNQFNYKSSYKASNGLFYFGGINGFNAFNPNNLNDNTFEPDVWISNVELLNPSDHSISHGDINRILHTTKQLILTHDQASLKINFVSLSYQAQEKNQYAYMLENQDKDWIQLGNQRNVTYINLPPGKYTFRIKGTNNNGIWSAKTDYLTLIVLPPWWKSRLAIVFYLVLFAAIVVYAYMLNQKRHLIKEKQKLEEYRLEKENETYHSKIDFFTNIAHEIRTPVSLIKAPLDCIIKKQEGSEETRENLSVINRNTDRLLDLVNQLLDFRKIEENLYHLSYQKTNLPALLNDIAYRFKTTAEEKNIAINTVIPAQMEVTTDRDALSKIASNLLSNALKHARHSIEICLAADADGSYLTLTVTDDGKGIDASYRAKVFEPFYQVEGQGYNPSKIGTGIGLALSRQLVDRLKGTIAIDDAKAGGCRFTVRLPIAPPTSDEGLTQPTTHAADKPAPHDPKQPEAGQQTAILVVEDNPELSSFLEKNLGYEYKVSIATQGAEALQLLEDVPTDLIVSDILMPVMDGIEFVAAVRQHEQFCHIPIVLLSAKTSLESKIEGLDIGADSYIEKPFSIDYLRAQISSLLKNRAIVLEKFAQSPMEPFVTLAYNKRDEEFIKRMNDEIEKNLTDTDFSIEILAANLSMSRSNLQRKIKGVSGMVPNDYIRVFRLKKAAALLASGDCRINEVCYLVGFNSPSYFAKCFQKQFGSLPKDFIKMH